MTVAELLRARLSKLEGIRELGALRERVSVG
jgi:hypothetical protein